MHELYSSFRQVVDDYYQMHGRHDLPWRQPGPDRLFDPYKILVSEVMLQQTQVSRVIPRYGAFLARFPTAKALAGSPLGEVLTEWQGLGYNRRAKYLWQAAGQVAHAYGDKFPRKQSELERLPGVGTNTAGAVLAYAFNEPVAFVETNIRTVFIHHFFKDQASVSDKAILRLVQATLDKENPRRWYWALMDYGSILKVTIGNLSRASKTYTKQSRFAGSLRQLRGKTLRLLSTGPLLEQSLFNELADSRSSFVLQQLEAEGLIQHQGEKYTLP
jgi:A/G-specific adenine glycosylase